MAAGESPAVARRRVRLALRRAREQKGLTQGQVADAMEWSLSKVMRIESGEVTISLNDLRPLLAYLDITDAAAVNDLMQAARVSRRRKEWTDEPRFREHITPAMRQLVQYEAEATTVRHFYANVFPGWLQTPRYAQALFEGWRLQLSEEQIEVRFEVRKRRREALLARKRPPKILLLLDESVTLRQMGGPDVLAEQLTEILRLIGQKWLVVRLVPFVSKAIPQTPIPDYDILELPAGTERAGSLDSSQPRPGPLAEYGDNAVLYREGWLADEINDNPDVVGRYREHFNALWSSVEDEATSEAMLRERAKIAQERANQSPDGL